jgi:hypothetical protein
MAASDTDRLRGIPRRQQKSSVDGPASGTHTCEVQELRRRLAAVTEEDTETQGRPILYGFGLGYVERISGRARRTIRRALADGVPLWDPVEAVAWALAHRGLVALADEVLEALDYERRYES